MTGKQDERLGAVSPLSQPKRSWFRRHKILTAIGVVFLLGVLGNLSNREPAPGSGAGSAPDASTPPASTAQPESPELALTAVELSHAFKENEVRANQTYRGKLARIEGEVFKVDEVFGLAVVTLKGATWSPHISCTFRDKSAKDRIAALGTGSQVALVGTIRGKSFGVDVKKCSFVSNP